MLQWVNILSKHKFNLKAYHYCSRVEMWNLTMKRVYVEWYEDGALKRELTSLTPDRAERFELDLYGKVLYHEEDIIIFRTSKESAHNTLEFMTPFHNGDENIRIMNIMMLLSDTKDALGKGYLEARDNMVDIWKSMPDVYGEFHPYLEYAWNECTNHVIYNGGEYHVDDWFDI